MPDGSVAQLNTDLTAEVRSQTVYQTPSNIGTLEGARMYDFMPIGRGTQFVAEEIIESSTDVA